jgi:glutamine synthetase
MTPDEVRSVEDAKKIIAEREADHVVIGVPDLQGFLRGKYISRDKALGALEKGMGVPGVVFALEPTDVILDVPNLSDDAVGYEDNLVRLLPETCREIPWEPPHRNLFFLGAFVDDATRYCPRAVYSRVAERAANMGFRPFHSCELEFTMFDETAKSAFDKGYKNLDISSPHKAYELLLRQEVRAEFHNGLMDMCRTMNLPVESVHEEMSPGFMEAALRYDEGVAAADTAVIFKTFAKAYAQRQGKLITFMARWSNDADGQSGHVHISLRGENGEPVFHDEAAERDISKTMWHFIAGMQALMPELLLMLGPNINSFKRYQPGIFSPIAATWGWENRTCAIRVIPGPPTSQRIECRTPGADANPYLSLGCLLGAGLWGIEHELEPTEPTIGNVYAQEVPENLRFPATFSEAIERFRASEAAKELFGEAFVEYFAHSRASLEESFRGLVTDVELMRYFEFS